MFSSSDRTSDKERDNDFAGKPSSAFAWMLLVPRRPAAAAQGACTYIRPHGALFYGNSVLEDEHAVLILPPGEPGSKWCLFSDMWSSGLSPASRRHLFLKGCEPQAKFWKTHARNACFHIWRRVASDAHKGTIDRFAGVCVGHRGPDGARKGH